MIRGMVVILFMATTATAQVAPTPVVTMDLRLTPASGTWQVYASDTPDNSGISGFSMYVKDVLTATLAAPKGFDTGPVYRGFTVGGTTFDAQTTEFEVLGGQNSSDAASVLFGIGQVAGSLTGIPPAIPPTPYEWPVLLASGTYNPAVTFNLSDINGIANVFKPQGSLEAMAAQVVWIPEPLTVTLLGLGGLALLRRRR